MYFKYIINSVIYLKYTNIYIVNIYFYDDYNLKKYMLGYNIFSLFSYEIIIYMFNWMHGVDYILYILIKKYLLYI